MNPLTGDSCARPKECYEHCERGSVKGQRSVKNTVNDLKDLLAIFHLTQFL